MRTNQLASARFIMALAFSASLCLCGEPAFAQAPIEGVASRVANGSALPSNAAPNTVFILVSGGTPTLYICNATPSCTSSGQWVSAGSGGGGGGGANVSLSNLSGVAINVPLAGGAGTSPMTVTGFQGNPSYGPTGVLVQGGNTYTGSTAPAGEAVLEGGIGQNGLAGSAYVLGGTTNSGYNAGSAYVVGGNATGSGFPGSVYIETGTTTGTARGEILLYAYGSSTSPGEIDLLPAVNTGGSAPGEVLVDLGAYLAFNGGNIGAGEENAYNPANVYVGNSTLGGAGGVFSPSFASQGATYPLAAQGTAAWNAQGAYGGSPASQAGQMTMSFANPSGTPEIAYSYNGGGLNVVASLTSSISGNAGTATAFAATPTQCPANVVMTGIATNGACNYSAAPNAVTMQEVADSGQSAASTYGTLWFSSTTHQLKYLENGSTSPIVLGASGFTNLFQQDSTGSAPNDTLEEWNAGDGNSQNLRVYHSLTNSTTFSRLQFTWDSANGAWQIGSVGGTGGGSVGDIEFASGAPVSGLPTVHWHFSATSPNALLPNANNAYDIGCVSGTCPGGGGPYAPRNIYVGTALYLAPGITPGCVQVASGGLVSSTGSACGSGSGMVYPGAGIANSTGSGWGTSYSTSGTGTVLALTASPTFTGTLNAAAASFSGNVNIGGTLTTSGSGPFEVIGNEGTLTAPGTSQSAIGFNASGHFQFALNASSTFNDLPIVQSCASNKWLSATDQLGSAGNCTQPAFSNLSGNLAVGQLPTAVTWPSSGTVPTTGTLVSGDYVSASAAGAVQDSTVVAGPYTTPWAIPYKCSGSTQSFLTSANKAFVWEVNLTYPLSTTKAEYDIVTADNNSGSGHNYDLALYKGVPSSTDNRVLHTGSSSSLGQPGTVFAAATGWQSLAWYEGTTTLQPGRYYLMLTSDCVAGTTSCAQFAGDSGFTTLYYNNAASIAAGGASPSTYSSAADSPSSTPGEGICIWAE